MQSVKVLKNFFYVVGHFKFIIGKFMAWINVFVIMNYKVCAYSAVAEFNIVLIGKIHLYAEFRQFANQLNNNVVQIFFGKSVIAKIILTPQDFNKFNAFTTLL